MIGNADLQFILQFVGELCTLFSQTRRLFEMKQAAKISRKTRDRYVPAKGHRFPRGVSRVKSVYEARAEPHAC